MLINRIDKKKAITIGIVIAVGVIAFKIIRGQIAKKKLLREFGDIKTVTDPTRGNVGGFKIPNQQAGFDPRHFAVQLKDAMDGAGTDEQVIWNTLEPLSKTQRKAVATYFGTYLGEGDTLDEWFEGDLSGKDLQRARGYFT